MSGQSGVTIYDVAAAAGVAPSTVSRTFSRPGRVNAETAERIRQVAKDLGYRANPLPQSRTDTPTKLIGLMISDIANPFYGQIIRGAQLAATEVGYDIVLVDSRESGSRERATLERLVPIVEGFVIGSSRLPDSTLRMIGKQRPMVVLNRELRGVPSVVTDNAGGVKEALGLLADLGHESVTYVAGPEASWADGVRFRALRDQAGQFGLHTQRIGPLLPTFDGGLAAAQTLLKRPPTAVLAFNSVMAVGVMHGLIREGLRIPEDVSVIGFDDTLVSRLFFPPLTSVSAPTRAMGGTAVTNVLAIARGARPSREDALVVPMHLRIGGSTGQRRRKRVSPALGTTNVSGSAAKASTSTVDGSR